MRVMVLVKATRNSEAGKMPDSKMLAGMGRFNDELAKAGVMLAGEGLHPSSRGKRVVFSRGDTAVVEGPFPETTELVAGFWIWNVKSMDEAVEWARRCPDPMPGEAGVLELRPIFESDDFGKEFTPELREQEDRIRAEMEKQRLPSMKIGLASIYVDDQDKALRFYTEVLGFEKKADVRQGAYRWLTVVSPGDRGGAELQLAQNDNPAAKAWQQAMFEQGQSAAMFHSDDVKRDYERIRARGGEFTMAPTEVTGAEIAVLNDTCGNLIQITRLIRP